MVGWRRRGDGMDGKEKVVQIGGRYLSFLIETERLMDGDLFAFARDETARDSEKRE